MMRTRKTDDEMKQEAMTQKHTPAIKYYQKAQTEHTCDCCGDPDKFRETYLLKGYRGNPQSTAYGKDDCSWCSDFEIFSCGKPECGAYCRVTASDQGYVSGSTFERCERFEHMFHYWKETEINPNLIAAAPIMAESLQWVVDRQDVPEVVKNYCRMILAKAEGR